jgi:hypothetical protein
LQKRELFRRRKEFTGRNLYQTLAMKAVLVACLLVLVCSFAADASVVRNARALADLLDLDLDIGAAGVNITVDSGVDIGVDLGADVGAGAAGDVGARGGNVKPTKG